MLFFDGLLRFPPESRFPRPRDAAPLNWRKLDCNVNIHVNDMPHVSFVWNDELIEYIGRHGVTQDEFAEVVMNSTDVRTSRSSRRPIVFGPTSTGKYLACVFDYVDLDQVVPVTAYEVD